MHMMENDSGKVKPLYFCKSKSRKHCIHSKINSEVIHYHISVFELRVLGGGLVLAVHCSMMHVQCEVCICCVQNHTTVKSPNQQ